MQAKLTTFLCLVALGTSLVYCTEDIDITLDELVYATTEEDAMWDPTATTFFQKVLDGDIAYFTDKMTYGKLQPPVEEGETGTAVPPTHTVAKRAATKDRRFLWPNGIIYYNISHSYSSTERNTILEALCTWEEHTCIRFVQRTTESQYITIYPGPGCSSYIGRVGGNQGVSVGRSCFSFHNTLHEIGHAIGFFHEQSRPDRDEHVDIIYDNIIDGAGREFRKLSEDTVDSLGVGYDYNSIMHYNHNLFAKSAELDTIVAIDPSIPVGGAKTLSELDAIQTNLLYEGVCPESNPERKTHCPVDLVPPGASLPPIPQPPFECGGTIEIHLDEWSEVKTIESPNYPTYTEDVDCGWFVRVPKGFQIMVTVEPMSIRRSSRCREDYIEVFESFGTSGYHLGQHCGKYRQYIITTITDIGYIHYHASAFGSVTGLKGFKAKIEAYDVDECRWASSCSHSCYNFPGGYECSCPEGYFLSSDGQNCFDTNECGLGNGGCDHKCVNRGGWYHCDCDEGYTLQSNGRTCKSDRDTTPIDLCEEANCEHICGVFGDEARCACRDGYVLASNRRQCEDINECATRNDGCAHTCTNTPGSFECSCREGYHLVSDGRQCEDINECATRNGGCAHTCTNTPGSFECSCREGYHLVSDGRQCEDINECATRNGGCAHTCTNTPGSFECSCREGYHLASDGRQCEDINECASGNGGCVHTCTNTPGSFECSCREGYNLVSDGRQCEDINECATRNGGCEHTCTNTPGSFECSCRSGYKLSSNGKTCEDIDECHQINLCSQVCVNTEGSYHCDCRVGYELQDDGITCLERIVNVPTPETTPTREATPTPEDGGFSEPGATVLTSPRGQFKSENWPLTYPVNVNPKWLIRCPSVNQRVELNFYQPFGIAGRLPECAKDWIKVYDGRNTDAELLGKFCYFTIPEVRRSSTNELLVVLYAGPKHSASRVGFQVSYSCVDVEPPRNSLPIQVEVDNKETEEEEEEEDSVDSTVPKCGETLRGSSGSFHSPNWPQTYNNNEMCVWEIVLPDEGRRVEITFEDGFGIAGNLPECAKDWVKVYDGLEDGARVSGPYCHYVEPPTFLSSGHRAKVVLFAGPKHNAARRGFSATYRSV